MFIELEFCLVQKKNIHKDRVLAAKQNLYFT